MPLLASRADPRDRRTGRGSAHRHGRRAGGRARAGALALLAPASTRSASSCASTVRSSPRSTTFVHRRDALDAPTRRLPGGAADGADRRAGGRRRRARDRAPTAELDDIAGSSMRSRGCDAVSVGATAPDAATIPRGVQVQPATLHAIARSRSRARRTGLIAVAGAQRGALRAQAAARSVSAVVGLGREQLYTDWLRTARTSSASTVRGVRADRSLFLTERAR